MRDVPGTPLLIVARRGCLAAGVCVRGWRGETEAVLIRVGAIILARYASRRFRGKALQPLAGRLLIDHVIERARRIGRMDDLVLATSIDSSDDALAAHVVARRVPVFRGSLHNVSHRVVCCGRLRGWTHVVRINADCPFVDPELIDKGLAVLVGSRLDVVTNVRPRTYPYGVSVEAFRCDALERAYDAMTQVADFEHVSRFFYRRSDDFRIYNMTNPHGDWSDVTLAVDEPDDLVRVARVAGALGDGVMRANTPAVVAAYRASGAGRTDRMVETR